MHLSNFKEEKNKHETSFGVWLFFVNENMKGETQIKKGNNTKKKPKKKERW